MVSIIDRATVSSSPDISVLSEISAARRRPLTDRKMLPSPLSEETFANRYLSPHSRTPSNDPPIFPPAPNPNAPLSSSPTSAASRAASNALSRALSLASKKLFGTGPTLPPSRYREYSAPSSPRRPQIIVGRGQDEEGERDPLEDVLLASLEELAQKTDVLTNWADEMYEYVKAVPQSKNFFGALYSIERYAYCHPEPLADPNKFAKRDGEAEKQAMRRKNADVEAEYNAVTCVAVYMLLMSFSQKGIDKLRNHQEHMKMRHPDEEFVVSEGFDDGAPETYYPSNLVI
jgi:serine/threonine-protein kinase ULK2